VLGAEISAVIPGGGRNGSRPTDSCDSGARAGKLLEGERPWEAGQWASGAHTGRSGATGSEGARRDRNRGGQHGEGDEPDLWVRPGSEGERRRGRERAAVGAGVWAQVRRGGVLVWELGVALEQAGARRGERAGPGERRCWLGRLSWTGRREREEWAG
jgi:hypothetical protein